MFVDIAPTINVSLNATSGVFLLLGFFFIRRANVPAHKACMLCAFGASTLFLISYVAYHAQASSTPFPGQGWIRPVYFAILISHIVLAAVILPMAITTLVRALRGRFDDHKRIARKTFPVWMYVSITGVVIYVLLYRVYGGS